MWQCQSEKGIYKELPDTRRRASKDRLDAAFVDGGVGFALDYMHRCSDVACEECGRWLQTGPDSWKWYCQCCHRDHLAKVWEKKHGSPKPQRSAAAQAANASSSSAWPPIPEGVTPKGQDRDGKPSGKLSRRQRAYLKREQLRADQEEERLALEGKRAAAAPHKSSCAGAAWIVDTGANDDIADPVADVEKQIHESWTPSSKEVLEAVGKQVEVQEHGRVSIPHFGDQNEALLVPNSPNCMAVGKRVRRLGYGFTWWPEDMTRIPPPQPGANWWIPNGDGSYWPLRCDASQDVPMLPPENRNPVLQAYANAGLAQGVRVFEGLRSQEDVNKLYGVFCDLRSDFEEVRAEIAQGVLTGLEAQREIERLQCRREEAFEMVRKVSRGVAPTPTPPTPPEPPVAPAKADASLFASAPCSEPSSPPPQASAGAGLTAPAEESPRRRKEPRVVSG